MAWGFLILLLAAGAAVAVYSVIDSEQYYDRLFFNTAPLLLAGLVWLGFKLFQSKADRHPLLQPRMWMFMIVFLFTLLAMTLILLQPAAIPVDAFLFFSVPVV